jgi:tRNA A-37 threonylcarbamoyl transferase component Bud32
MSLKINLSHLKSKIDEYVKEYYSLKEKPVVEELPKEFKWFHSMISQYVEYVVVNIELKDIQRIEVSERMIDYDHQQTQTSCVRKKGYDVEKRLGEYSDKFLLKGNKTAKVKQIYLWLYKQRDEMKSVINNEFKICKKAEALNIGPKTYDTFICYNEQSNIAYKVIVSEYIQGMSLDEWMKTERTPEERQHVYNIVKKKIDKMHENGIIHTRLYSANIILKQGKGGKKVVDAFITDFVHSYDVQDKSMWDYNKWIQDDRRVLNDIQTGKRRFGYQNVDDVVNYVAAKLRPLVIIT